MVSSEKLWESRSYGSRTRPGEESRMDTRLNSIDDEVRRVWSSGIPGKAIGPFRVGHLVGNDEVGAVFKAIDVQRDRPIRLKVLWPKLAMDDRAFARFVRAMRTTIDLRHPNLVRLIAAGKDGEYCYMACEYIEAEPITSILKEPEYDGKCPWEKALKIGLDVTAALQHAHERKIVHRDIKPSNILIDKDGQAKLDNLIVAKAIEGSYEEQISVQGALDFIGELAFVAPEALIGTDDIDCRSDIYSLGATLYALMAGHPPFQADSMVQLGRMIQDNYPDLIRTIQPTMPEAFDKLIRRMMAKKPADRPEDPTALLEEFERIMPAPAAS